MLARARRGSRNRERARARLARLRRREADGRSTASRTNAAALVRSAPDGRCPAIAREDLAVASMVRSAAGTAAEPGVDVAAKRGLDRARPDATIAFRQGRGGQG